MSDLVEKMEHILQEWPPSPRAAIAAVLDDLQSEIMEPDEELAEWAPKLAEQRLAFDHALLGMLAAKRKELGL